MQSVAQRLEDGGALSCAGVVRPAQPFLAVLLRQLFPPRPVVVVTEGLQSQESFQQDIETWLRVACCAKKQPIPFAALNPQLLFYPDWEIRPHEAKLPHARIVVGPGQMHSDDLEEVLTRFVNGEADVLLSTTIIESGLDIPNANTIIMDRADRFGLSDLYPLRGRVGRYKHQVYACQSHIVAQCLKLRANQQIYARAIFFEMRDSTAGAAGLHICCQPRGCRAHRTHPAVRLWPGQVADQPDLPFHVFRAVDFARTSVHASQPGQFAGRPAVVGSLPDQ